MNCCLSNNSVDDYLVIDDPDPTLNMAKLHTEAIISGGIDRCYFHMPLVAYYLLNLIYTAPHSFQAMHLIDYRNDIALMRIDAYDLDIDKLKSIIDLSK